MCVRDSHHPSTSSSTSSISSSDSIGSSASTSSSSSSSSSSPSPAYYEQQDPIIPCKIVVEDLGSGDEWKERLIRYSTLPRDLSISLNYAYLHHHHHHHHHDTPLASPSDGNEHPPLRRKYEVYLLCNHAGLDGAGLTSYIDSLLSYLSQLCAGKAIDDIAIVRRPFLDVVSRFDPIVELSKHTPPPMPDTFMPPPTPMTKPTPLLINQNLKKDNDKRDKVKDVGGDEDGDDHLEEQHHIPNMRGIWYEYDVDTTSSLVRQCKKRGVTVQSAISTAAILAYAALRRALYPLPQNIINQVPCNVRDDVTPPLHPADILVGSSTLWWQQMVKPDFHIWKVVKDASENIKVARESGFGLAFLSRVELGKYEDLRPFTAMSTSMGVTCIKPQYGDISVCGLRIMGATYNNPSGAAGWPLLSVHTTLGRLNTGFFYSTRTYNEEEATFIAAAQHDILSYLASPSSSSLDEDDIDGISVSTLIERIASRHA
eukprot:TRINITY_DN11087_c0_g3_i1.p1 TRINITY_DN11087_c0_g3~~TRINITY_DN11087_c0_g3_i1.p1  ORF type:complete len:546 (+),score=119.59 TRINITY_DN11087_c0_g3_i1:185-1639(+)